jgi:outer membrane lipase/esterase
MNNEDVEKTLKGPIIVEAAEQVSEAIDQATSSIENRLRSLGMPAFALAEGEDQGGGVAAGEDSYKNGAWFNAYYGAARQKARGEAAGFKSHTAGAMLGADTMVTDEHTIGMALGYTDNRVKHKDGNEGDTSRVKTYTISIYGMHDISDKWFVQGVGLFSRNAINNRELRGPVSAIEIARGDFDVNAYGTEILVGHNHLVTGKTLMTTTMGLEYLRLSGSRYKETGTTNNNFLITKKDDNKLDAIIGTGFSYNGSFKNYTVIPEMHGNIYYDVLNQSPRVSVQVAGLVGDRLVNKTAEQTRAFYNLGCGLSVLRGATEFSAGYDLYLGKKYIGHQGSLKVRINF